MIGRLCIGLIVSQGLFYALERLLTGILLAAQGGTVEEVWASPANIIWLQVAQLFAVLVGGILAGGGQQSPWSLGAMMGAWNGVLAILFQQLPADIVSPLAYYASPLMHAALALVGAAIGSRIWRPVVVVDPGPILASNIKKPPPPKPMLAGRIAWFRVALGTALAAAGWLYADQIFYKMLEWSGGKLGTDGSIQDVFIIWEIRIFAVLLGGAFAGAMTTNGLKQGLLVALAASILLVGVQSTRKGDLLEAGAIILLSTFASAVAGGWFGGTLFPPVSKYNPRRAMASAQA
jgi:hypothetical protein